MKRWLWLFIGTLFLICDLAVASLVYVRLDPGAAHAALRRLNLSQQASSTPTLRRASTSPQLTYRPAAGSSAFKRVVGA